MPVVTKQTGKVQYKVKTDPMTGDKNYTLKYRGRHYSMGFRPVKDKVSYQLWEEYHDDDGIIGAGEFYTSHNTFKDEQSALKDAAATIKEMEDFIWEPDEVDAKHEAMVDSYFLPSKA